MRALVMGFDKKGSGQSSITWPKSVDEAPLCGLDWRRAQGHYAISYQIRFTPRKVQSIRSAVNVQRVAALTAEGRMMPTGLAAFEKRSETKSRRGLGHMAIIQRSAAGLPQTLRLVDRKRQQPAAHDKRLAQLIYASQ